MMAMFRSLSADIGGASLAWNRRPRKEQAGFGRCSARGRAFSHAVEHGVRASRIDPAMAHFPQDCRHVPAIESVCFTASLQGELPDLQSDETTTRARFWRRIEPRTRR